ncbi:MAG: response regulator transcription factor, partial [Acidobacteriota bacterium]|nr:response regulator transcription factor [Acidobacteriota bacterium]
VEDDPRQAASLRRGLVEDSFSVDVAVDGREGLWLATHASYDVVILDLMLPALNGFDVCRRIRQEGVWSPVLILTAKTGEYDEIESLDMGADDFITKPVSYPVLLARLRALLRRDLRERPTQLRAGDLIMDPATRVVTRAGVPVTLTRREYSLLELLMRRVDEVVENDEILDHVWGTDFEGSPNIVAVYIGYLRRKIDRPFGLTTLITAPGGYRLLNQALP